ncbi:MAG: hypothetical protein ACKO02_11750 [Cyanobium sp.]
MRHTNIPPALPPSCPLLLPLMLVALWLPVGSAAVAIWRPAAVHARPAAVAASRQAWTVALPAMATVRLRRGGSLSGRLLKLTATAITLAMDSQIRTLALADVSGIDFAQPNDLWVTLPQGRRQLRPIRGLSLPLDPLPSASIQLDRGGENAVVDLTPVLSEAQFAKLTRNPEVVHVLKRLEITPEGSIGLWVRPYGMLP